MKLTHNTLYYVYDPMCSWCYAFEKSLTELQAKLPPILKFETILGGLAADSLEPMPIATQAMIKGAWGNIEKTVPDIHFNYDFWTNNTPLRSTYPACRAILAAEKQGLAFSAPLRKAIQTAYYQKAQNPSLSSTLQRCAEKIKLNLERFSVDFESDEIALQLAAHIEFSQQLNATSYPSLRLVLNETVYVIPINYTQIAPTLNRIEQLISQHNSQAIQSPCVGKCCLNESDVCLGCFRQLDEITHWQSYTETEKQQILNNIKQRKPQAMS